MDKKIFIGSSIEGVPVAEAIQVNLLRDSFHAVMWNDQDVFKPGKSVLDNLIGLLDVFGFAIFVFSKDDVIHIRNRDLTAVRDNVIFELGLFMGRMGPENVFFVVPEDCRDFRIMSDLSGIVYLTYSDIHDMNIGVKVACNSLRSVLRQRYSIPGIINPEVVVDKKTVGLMTDDDYISFIEKWLSEASNNSKVIKFDEVDEELKMPVGTAKKLIVDASKRWRLGVVRIGPNTVVFKRI